MVKGVYRTAAEYKQPRVFASIVTVPKVLKWTPSLAIWGGTALGAVLFFADSITLYRNDVLAKLPGIGWYYQSNVHPEETPF